MHFEPNTNPNPLRPLPGDSPRAAEGIRLLFPTALSVLVILCWVFPRYWFTETDRAASQIYLAPKIKFAGWEFKEIAVSKSAEAALVADRILNGELTNRMGGVIRIFVADRVVEDPNEIGLFVHTPDRCWTEAGWIIAVAPPETVSVDIQGVKIRFERRIFERQSHRELVYFTGLIGGRTLPYRLDHNLSVGLRSKLGVHSGSVLRASDIRFWKRVWDALVARQPLFGSKQFIRVSISLADGSAWESEEILQEFLGNILKIRRPAPSRPRFQ